jgi:GntR family transcriptional regulator
MRTLVTSATEPTAARLPDRASPMPLWAQVSADIRRRCAARAFADGVPGEHVLCVEYQVSRHTIREALRSLRSEGVIRSQRGRGSIVTPGGFSQHLGAVYSLFQSVEAQGAAQTSEVIRLETVVEPLVAGRLGLPDDALLVVLERLRRADGEPLAHDSAWLPHTLAHPILQADFTRTALYDELAERVGVRVDSGHERIAAAVADDATGSMLGLPNGSAILVIERLGMSEGRPVEWRETQVRGDRFSVATEWGAAAALTVSLSSTAREQARTHDEGRSR